MAIKSYLVVPIEGKRRELLHELSNINGCETTPSINHDLIILVTNTHSKGEEKMVTTALQNLKYLKDMSLVLGYDA